MDIMAIDLDHAGTVVRDLDKGRAAYEAMGFRLTAKSQHRGAIEPGGEVQLLGQGNHCAMLQRGYLEVLGIVDSSLPAPAGLYLDKYEGLHIVAMRPRTIEAALAVAGKGGALDAPRDLGRQVLFGPEGSETRPVRFINIRWNATAFPEATFLYTEHLTRETMWQPHLLEHPNKALALDQVFICSPEPALLADRMSKVLGVMPQARSDGQVELQFRESSLVIVTPGALDRLYPGVPAPDRARPVGYQIRTASIDAVSTLLTRNAVPYKPAPIGGLFVGPAHACGNVIHFIERN